MGKYSIQYYILAIIFSIIFCCCNKEGVFYTKRGSKYLKEVFKGNKIFSIEEITIDTLGDFTIQRKNGIAIYFSPNGDTSEILYYYNNDLFGNNYIYKYNKPKLYFAIGQNSKLQTDTLIKIEYNEMAKPNIIKNKELSSPFFVLNQDSVIGNDTLKIVVAYNYFAPNIYYNIELFTINQDSSFWLKAPVFRIFSKRDFVQENYFKISRSNKYSIYCEWKYRISGEDTITQGFVVKDVF